MATYTGIKAILQEFLRRALPSGMIVSFGGASAPKGWLLCNGAAVSRTTYKNLFSAIGTSYGAGDGSTTFNLPDFRECVPVGAGTRGSGVSTHDTYSVGTFKDDQFKSHTHSFSGTTGGMSGNATGSISCTAEGLFNGRGSVTATGNLSLSGSVSWAGGDNNEGNKPNKMSIDVSHTHSFSGTTGSTGGATTHGKQLGVNYIIKY